MRAPTVFAVAPAARLDRVYRQNLRGEQLDVLVDRGPLGAVHGDAHLIQLRKSARSYASHDNDVDLLVVQRLHGTAGAVRVVLVAVADR